MTYQRLKGDQEHSARKSRQGSRKSISRANKPQLTENMRVSGATPSQLPLESARGLNTSNLLDISGLSAFNPMEGGAERGCAHFGGVGVGDQSHNMSVGGAPSDLGQSLLPYLSTEMKATDTQCDIWGVAEH